MKTIKPLDRRATCALCPTEAEWLVFEDGTPRNTYCDEHVPLKEVVIRKLVQLLVGAAFLVALFGGVILLIDWLDGMFF